MTKKAVSFFLALTLIVISVPAMATTPSISLNDLNQVGGTSQSPTLSVALNNLNQVTGTVTMPASPTLSVALNNLNQVTGAVTSPASPTLSVTLGNLNQITGAVTSPTLSMTLGNLNQVNGIAAGAPLSPALSIALNNPNHFSAIAGNYGVPLTGLFTIMDTLTEDAQTEFDSIAAYVGNRQSVAGYFGMDIPQLVLKGELSSGYLGLDASALILSEYVSLAIHDYQATSADVAATFGFASEYQDGQPVVVMFGYHNENGAIVWNALNTVATNGQVKIDFPADLLLAAGSEAILGILS